MKSFLNRFWNTLKKIKLKSDEKILFESEDFTSEILRLRYNEFINERYYIYDIRESDFLVNKPDDYKIDDDFSKIKKTKSKEFLEINKFFSDSEKLENSSFIGLFNFLKQFKVQEIQLAQRAFPKQWLDEKHIPDLFSLLNDFDDIPSLTYSGRFYTEGKEPYERESFPACSKVAIQALRFLAGIKEEQYLPRVRLNINIYNIDQINEPNRTKLSYEQFKNTLEKGEVKEIVDWAERKNRFYRNLRP